MMTERAVPMFASVLQLIGLVIVMVCMALMSPLAGAATFGAVLVFVGLALDGD